MSDELFRVRGSGALVASAAGREAAQTSSPGSLVGSSGLVYRPLRQLGEGGMARVFLACALGSAGFSKLVVLKMMRRYLEATEYRNMFLQEARLSAHLNHPNLVQVYEVVDSEETPFLVMEYLEGKPLTELRRLDTVPREMVLTAVCEALVGLHHAHEFVDFEGNPLNIVHRDISPHNIFVTYDGAIKVLDFGVAKTTNTKGQTRNGEIKGKLSYMSPEQFLGEDVDRRADVFAMGAVLWELMIGAPLWDKADQGLMVQRLATGDIPRPPKSANLDPELEAIIVRATAANPAERYSSAIEMHHALAAYRGSRPKAYTPRDVGLALSAAFDKERTEDRAALRAAVTEVLATGDDSERPTDVPLVAQANPDVVVTARPGTVWSRERKRWPLLAAGLAAAILGFAAFKWNTSEAPAPAAPAAGTAVAPSPANVRLAFHVTPASARVEIDGVLRGTGTFDLVVPSDANEHLIIVSAADHEPVSRRVNFASNQQLDLTLAATPPTKAAAVVEETASSSSGTKARPHAGARAAKPVKTLTPVGSASPTGDRCATPYYFKDGIKTFRPECL